MKPAKLSRGFFREIAAAKSDARLLRLLTSRGVVVNEMGDAAGIPPALRAELEERGGYDPPLATWRTEQKELARVVDGLDQAGRMLADWLDSKGEPRAAKPDQAPWEQHDEGQLALAFRWLSTEISLGLRRTTTLELSGDLQSLKPVPRNVLGAAWLQLAEAAQALVKRKPTTVCKRPGCGVVFTPKRKTAKFCSAACRVGAWVPKG